MILDPETNRAADRLSGGVPASSGCSTPARRSACTHATLPSMSSRHNRLSKLMDALMRCIRSDAAPVKRPP